MLWLGVLRASLRACNLCSATSVCNSNSQLYAQSLRGFRKCDQKLYNKGKALECVGQRLLDSLPEPTVKKMEINLVIFARSILGVTIKWPESRIFYVRATSKEEVENRIYEMLYKYLVGKNVIVAANHSSMLEVENKSVHNQAQEKKVISGSDSSLLLAARRRSSAKSIIGGSNMFKRSLSSILSRECNGTLSRMMHDLTITTKIGDKETERKVCVKKTRSQTDDTPRNSADDSANKRRKVELTELSCPSVSITFQNNVVPEEDTSLNVVPEEDTSLNVVPEEDTSLNVVPEEYTSLNVVPEEDTSLCVVSQEDSSSSTKTVKKKTKKRKGSKATKAKKRPEMELNPVVLQMGRHHRVPTSVVNSFYQKLTAQLGLEDGYFNVRYEEKSHSPSQWECMMQVKWPEPRTFRAIKQSKTQAATEASLHIMEWLQSLGKITKKGSPVLGNPEGVEIASTKVSLEPNALQEPKQLLNGYTEDKRSQFNTDSKNNPCGNNVEINIEPTSELQQIDNGLQKVATCFPIPKYTIQQFCQSVANSLGSEDYKLKTKYRMISETPSVWECSLQIKWPEPSTFIATKKSKSLAMSEAALLSLQWLQSLRKITKQGLPIMHNPKEAVQSAIVEVSLDSDTVKQARRLVDVYIQNIKPQIDNCDTLSYCSRDPEEESNDIDWKMGPDIEEQQLENELFACGEQRNPVTGRIMRRVSQEALNKRSDELYRRWQKRTKKNQIQENLPIMEYREIILKMLENNRILVIKGQPGCGKSTLVPQFLMEHMASKKQGAQCNIIVTQPRRIAAISIAEWVTRAREEMLGDVVGYQVRLKNVLPYHVGGAILFCSTGILLRRLVNNPGLFGASHIIVDEAHERDINIDFLLILLRRALKLNPDLKVIVMSATINAELFQNYFNEAATISIPGFTYPVKSIFLDEFFDNNIPVKCSVNEELPAVNVKAVVDMINWIHHNRHTNGAILCFLPGWPEIRKIQEALQGERELTVLPAHSKIAHSEQRKIFLSPPAGTRKVILSTNITETSITIDDVEFVIDCGMHREHRLDVDKGLRTFGNHWISRANVNQRRGRAGRVKPGESFHLYTTRQLHNMETFSVPEIMRAPLEKTVLDCKAYSREEKAAEFLGQMPEPPALQAVEHAVNELMQLGALDVNENLTALGKRIALFTVHPKLSVALIHAVVLRCLNPIVTVASVFGNDVELFYGVLSDKGIIKQAKKAYHPTSDHLAISWLYQQWETLSTESAQKASAFCYPRKLLPDQMELVGKLRHLVSQHLQECAILKDQYSFADLEAECNMYVGNDELVKGILLSAFGTLMISQDYDMRNGRLVKEKVLVSDTGNRVSLGSESVNHRRTNFMSKFLTYFQQTRLTERRVIMVREATMVSPLTVLLFTPGEFVITEIQPRSRKWDGYVLVKHKKRKVELIMKEQEAVLFLQFRAVLWDVVYYFIVKEGVASEDIDRYKSISNFRKDLLQALSDMMLKAGAAIEYKDGILVE